jgi:hypothetical protein
MRCSYLRFGKRKADKQSDTKCMVNRNAGSQYPARVFPEATAEQL